jgi:hypothetical protein
MDTIFELIRQGGFAAVAGLTIWLLIRKDRQVAAKDEQIAGLYDRLEAKSERYVQKYTQLSTELNQTVGALADALELEVE